MIRRAVRGIALGEADGWSSVGFNSEYEPSVGVDTGSVGRRKSTFGTSPPPDATLPATVSSRPMDHDRWMQAAIDEARRGIAAGQSPFGAVIVCDGRALAAGHNEVWLRGDPTAHAEVVAIQRAATAIGSIDLSGCTMYTTCEPCPMCAAAIHWSKLDAVCFGATIADAARAGFTELALSAADVYRQGGSRVQVVSGISAGPCAKLFHEWNARPDRRPY